MLDNFEHLLAAREDVLALVADCPHLAVLATSRRPCACAASASTASRPWSYPPADPDADEHFASVALFLDRVGRLGSN